MLLLLLLLLLCGSLLTTPTTTHSHQPSRALTQRQPRACGLPFTHTLSHIATPSIGSWRTEFLHLLFPLSSCARSASVHACLLLALAACLCLIAAFTASHTRPHNSPHQPDTSHTHRPRANNANHHSSHSPLLTVLCDLSALRLSASRCLSQLHTHTNARPLRRTQTRSWLTATLAHTHTQVCLALSLFALSSLLPGHTDRLERRAHTHHPCVARGAASVTRSSLSFTPVALDESIALLAVQRPQPRALTLSASRCTKSHPYRANGSADRYKKPYDAAVRRAYSH